MQVERYKISLEPIALGHIVVNSLLLVSTWAVVGLRLASRRLSGAGWGMDDLFISLAMPQGLAIYGIATMFAVYDKEDATPMEVASAPPILRVRHFFPSVVLTALRLTIQQYLVAFVFLFASATMTIKFSVLSFYLRCFIVQSLRRAVKIVMVWVGLWSAGNILQIFLICRPFAASYDTSVRGTCGDVTASYIAIGCFNAITDVVILCLPIPTIWSLRTSTKTKIALTAVFAAGLLTTVVSVCRIAALASMEIRGNAIKNSGWPYLLTCLEVHISIITISLPTLRPAYNWCLGHWGIRGQVKQSQHKISKTIGSLSMRRPRHYCLDESIHESHQLGELPYVGDISARNQSASRAWANSMNDFRGVSGWKSSADTHNDGPDKNLEELDGTIKIQRSCIIAEKSKLKPQSAKVAGLG